MDEGKTVGFDVVGESDALEEADIFQFDGFVNQIFASRLQILDEDDFEKIRCLGSGRTMVVYEGRWKSRSEPVALK
jgi:hypothetical protein